MVQIRHHLIMKHLCQVIWLAIYSTTCHITNAWVSLPYKYSYRSQNAASKSAPFKSITRKNAAVEQKSEPVLRTLYTPPPRIEDFNITNSTDAQFVTKVTNGTLQTEEGSPHTLYYEVHQRIPIEEITFENTNPSRRRGLTALVLHGGPGAGCFPRHANFFSPKLYEYVVLLDQRGCGRSVPLGEVAMNTLELLVLDVERLRCHLLSEEDGGVRPWDCILGGSWGCTLALAYAHSFPTNVRSMVLRGVCLFRRQEIDWLFGDPPANEDEAPLCTSNLRDLVAGGKNKVTTVKSTIAARPARASQLFRDGWKEFCKGVNMNMSDKKSITNNGDRNALIQYYHRLLGSDPLIRARAAQSWFRWEMGIYTSGYPTKDKTNDTNSELLVWNPARQIWHYENARVCSDQSVISVEGFGSVDKSDEGADKPVEESVVQSLRRYSKPPMQQQTEREVTANSPLLEPLAIQNVTDASTTSAQLSASPKRPGNQTSNSTFDPTKFIPAQAMLTCYYSTNQDYVLHPYREFLSLSPQNTSWYTSLLPPSLLNDPIQLQASTSKPEPTYPLPPCIAIQGGLDAICPPDTALDLHHAWKELELRIATGSGHSMYDPVIAGEIVKALDRFGNALIDDQ